ncbi:MAG: ketol-acid reductoisomerase, partial [Candidatus Limnocylindrales bacterium]
RIVDAHVRETMQQVLAEIQDGTFARRWIAENEAGRPEFNRLRRQDQDHLIEQVGAELRSKMRWLNPVEVRPEQAQASAERSRGEGGA